MTPSWAATVHACRVNKVRVKACCPHCPRYTTAKLKRIERKFGEAFNLFDAEVTCPVCGRPGFFVYSPGRSTPMRPMRRHT